MAKKWQRLVATHKKRISLHSENANGDRCTTTISPSSTKANKGHFVVYSFDHHRFEIPLSSLKHEIFGILLEMSEEEFGLPNEGPIVLPVYGHVLDNIVSVIKQGVTEDVHKALLSIVSISRCSISSSHQEIRHGQLLVY